MDQVLIATNAVDLVTFLALARETGMGLELQAFSEPAALGGDSWKELLAQYKRDLAGYDGIVGVHGAFFDMNSASLDPAVVALTRRRYMEHIRVAAELEANYVVFHLNYLGLLRLYNYRAGWHRRQIDFWGSLMLEAEAFGIPVLLENSWEDEPSIIVNVLEEINHPGLAACLDIAHATLYSSHPIDSWIEQFAPHLHISHLNNHDGHLDLHWPLNKGVIDYPAVLFKLRQLSKQPIFCLEMPTMTSIKASLGLLNLNHTVPE